MPDREWRRTDEVAEPTEAFAAIGRGADWIFFWCGGGSTRPSASGSAAEQALSYARETAVTSAEFRRLAEKAARKGRTKTIVFAEMWRRSDGQEMVVFHEGGPHALPDRLEPDR